MTKSNHNNKTIRKESCLLTQDLLELLFLEKMIIIQINKKKEHKISLLEQVINHNFLGHAFFASENDNNISNSDSEREIGSENKVN